MSVIIEGMDMPQSGPVTLAEKLVPIDASETKEPCFWCKRKPREWDVIRKGSIFRCDDQVFGPYVPDKLINYCFHCGRKLK